MSSMNAHSPEGTAPKDAGKDDVNPGSEILSGKMMLRRPSHARRRASHFRASSAQSVALASSASGTRLSGGSGTV